MNTRNGSIKMNSGIPPVCYHCGLPCEQTDIVLGDKHFCCRGCQTVYEILEANDLCQYYNLNETPGKSPEEFNSATRFGYLDDETVKRQLVDFSDGKIARVTFSIPNMHCSSCIWLLEHLYQINPGVERSEVNFMRKELAITFREDAITLRGVVELLASIGYEPQISLDDLQRKAVSSSNKSLYIKIGVAGFAFGNIMLLSFPEYFSIANSPQFHYRQFFGILNLLLALPVLFYSASEYLISAYKGLIHKTVNIDVPISMGILTLFFRSFYEIVNGSGAGYMDSFAGLVFLLLIGKLFQKKTYDTLSFDRDYKSYFPVAVTRKDASGEQSIPLSQLAVGDRILIRHQELIPADSILISGRGLIDYSFVTGEAQPQERASGDMIYAGGRQTGAAIELEVVKEVSQSYLTQLWNNEAFGVSKESRITTLANSVSKYFTLIVIGIALLGLLVWLPVDVAVALNAFTAVLIVACPCALALSTPFTLGNVLRIFGKHQFYLKNTSAIEALSHITAVVFDKTGTLTQSGRSAVEFVPVTKSPAPGFQLRIIKSVAVHSTHPLSVAIYRSLKGVSTSEVQNFQEIPGMGVTAVVDGHTVRIGSRDFVGTEILEADNASRVIVSLDDEPIGYFRLKNQFRDGLAGVINWLKQRYKIFLLSGDNDREKPHLEQFFPPGTEMHFNQSPHDKLAYIQHLQKSTQKVLMIGDGLNDAGALQQSDVGISVSDDLNNFSPACDGILHGNHFSKLPKFLELSRQSMNIIRFNFALSFMYNIIGLTFAVKGALSPLLSAVLMPVSSVTVIVIATGLTNLFAWKLGLRGKASDASLKAALSPEDENLAWNSSSKAYPVQPEGVRL